MFIILFFVLFCFSTTAKLWGLQPLKTGAASGAGSRAASGAGSGAERVPEPFPERVPERMHGPVNAFQCAPGSCIRFVELFTYSVSFNI